VTEEASDLLARLVRVDTTNPPGREAAAVELLAEHLRHEGIAVEVVRTAPGRANLLARIESPSSSARPLLLLSHLDTFAAEPAGWPAETPPFGGVVKDGALWGRGTLGGKGLAVAQALALVRLKRAGISPSRPVILAVTADGVGSGEVGLGRLIQLRPELMRAELVLGPGGFSARDLVDARETFAVAIAEKGFAEIDVVGTGDGGSPASPAARTASWRLARALERIAARRQRSRLTPAVIEFLDAISSEVHLADRLAWSSSPLARPIALHALGKHPLTRALIQDTVAVTRLAAGGPRAPVPDRARARLRCQLLPGTAPGELLAELRAAVDDPQVFLTIASAEEATTSTASKAVLAAIEAGIFAHDPRAIVAPVLSPQTTDGRLLRRHGLPVYGWSPYVVSIELLATAEGHGERLPMAALARGIDRMSEVVVRLAAPTPPGIAGSIAPPSGGASGDAAPLRSAPADSAP
jgi:acetylornithine deacetylase/succinyl-diaminopimelate desuccinylase-like protein